MSLYKYVGIKGKRVLETLAVRLSQPAAFNDPFDVSPKFQLLSKAEISGLPAGTQPGTHQLTPEVIKAMLGAVAGGIEVEIRERVQGGGAPVVLDNNAIARAHYSSMFGALCLADSPTNLLLWAHYADCHRGLAIQFDEAHDFFKVSSADETAGLGLRSVEYGQDRPSVTAGTIEGSPEVFVRKSPDWTYEKERRLIRRLSDTTSAGMDSGGREIYLLAVPSTSITGVLLGAYMPQDEQDAVNELCQRDPLTHVQVHNMYPSPDKFELLCNPPLPGVGRFPPGGSCTAS